MKKKKVLGLSLAMMLAVPTVSAFADGDAVIEKESTVEVSASELDRIKEQAVYSFEKVGEEMIHSAIIFIDGVEVEVLLKDEMEVTDDMVQKASAHVTSLNNEVVLAKTNTIASLAPEIGTYANEDETTATTYGTPKKHTFLAEGTVAAIKSTITYGFGAMASAAGARLGAPGATAAGVVGAAVGGSIANKVKPYYTTSKFMRSYSNRYGYYLVDFYCTIYSNASRTTVHKVYMEYDVKSSTSVIGYS